MWTEEEMNKYLGSYVTDRAMRLSETNTTYVQGRDSYKVQIKYLSCCDITTIGFDCCDIQFYLL